MLPMFFSLIIFIINDHAPRKINKWQNLNESLFVDRCFFFLLTCFSLVTFPRILVQIFRSDRPTYVRNILFYSFYTFEVMTHFVAEASFLYKYLTTYSFWIPILLGSEYCSLFCRALLTITKVDIKFQSST